MAFNDIDYCMKVRAAGKLVVYNPYALLYHYESKSRGLEDTPEKIARFNREIRIFSERWPKILEEGDPYYNPNLTLRKSNFALRDLKKEQSESPISWRSKALTEETWKIRGRYMTATVTVIIPNYNGMKFLEPCFEALKAQTYRNFKILVVDNGSSDGSKEWLKAQGVDTIFLEENTGFSGAVNIGIKAADTPYVILLNNDTKADEYYVAEMVKAIERSPKIFSVSSRMIQMYHPDLMDDAGDMYCILGWAYQRGIGQSVKKYGRSRRVFSASPEPPSTAERYSSRSVISTRCISPTWRIWTWATGPEFNGYDNVYCPAAVVYHVGSGTSGSKYNAFKVKLAARNSVYLNYKNMPLPQLVLNAAPLALGMAVKRGFF